MPDDEHDALAWWPADPGAWPPRPTTPLRGMAARCSALTCSATLHLRFRFLRALSFVNSTVFTALLVVWLVPGLHAEEMVFGWTHGCMWIVLSLLCLAAVRRRTIPFWLAVVVAVIGGLGPYAGSVGLRRGGPPGVAARAASRHGGRSKPALES